MIGDNKELRKEFYTSERVRNKVLIKGSPFRLIPRPSGNSNKGWGSVRIFKRSLYGFLTAKKSLKIYN